MYYPFKAFIGFSAVGLVILFSVGATAQWENGEIEICTEPSSQQECAITPDSMGGAYIVWSDNRAGEGDIYIQRVSSSGIVLWQKNGLAVCSVSGEQFNPTITTDIYGNAIVIWADFRNDILQVFAQKISPEGVLLWNTGGIQITTFNIVELNGKDLVSMPDGSIAIVYSGITPKTGSQDIYLQKLDRDGSVVPGFAGIGVCMYEQPQKFPRIASCNNGGVIVAWTDRRSIEHYDYYAQYVDSQGSIIWTEDGVYLNAATDDVPLKIVSGTSGGVYICYHAPTNLYLHHFCSDDNSEWVEPLSFYSEGSQYFQIGDNGDDGVLVAWLEGLNNRSIIVQNYDSIGNKLWGDEGTSVAPLKSGVIPRQILHDGSGGAFVIWTQNILEVTASDVFAQKINNLGEVEWPAYGSAISSQFNDQKSPVACLCNDSVPIVAWVDARNLSTDIFANTLYFMEYQDLRRPFGLSVIDIPNDQGGSVRVKWNGAPIEFNDSKYISHYSIWRAVDIGCAAFTADPGGHALSAEGLSIDLLDSGELAWEWLDDIPAMQFRQYSFTSPTYNDSTAAGILYHHFIIASHKYSDTKVYYLSEPDSGYSIDNIAPHSPLGFIGMGIVNDSPEGLQLSWDSNSDPDISRYEIYKGMGPDFPITETTSLASTSGTGYIDSDWSMTDEHCYKLIAVDVHDNKSSPALLTPAQIVIGVLLESYNARSFDDHIELNMKLSAQLSKEHLKVYRALVPSNEFAFIESVEITQAQYNYSIKDYDVLPGTDYRYRVEFEEGEGAPILLLETSTISTPEIPITLFQNFPNPFNPSTRINYYLPYCARVTLGIYTVDGRLVQILEDEKQNKGFYSVEWTGIDGHGRHMNSGVYFYRLAVGKEVLTRKMILLR